MTIEKIKCNRYLFLKKLYEVTEGDSLISVDMWEFGKELRFSRSETSKIVAYLKDEGLLKMVALGGEIGIIHRGVVEVEMALSEPDEPTKYFPPVNIIIGYMDNSNTVKNGPSIVIGDNSNDNQIQQNAANANQTLTNTQTFNYEKVLDVLNEIKECFDNQQFTTAFNDNSDQVKKIVIETINEVERKEEPRFIKKSLQSLKDLAIGASGSLIGSGILALLATLSK